LYGVLSKATWAMLEIVHDERTPILQVPGSVTYGCVMVGMVLLGVLALLAAWRAWRRERVELGAADPSAHAAQG
jgi:TRAP-type transport system small permease protein